MNLKKITVLLFFIFVLFAFNKASADVVSSNDQVVQFFKMMSDDTYQTPESLKAIKPYAKKLATDIKLYEEKKKDVFTFISGLSKRDISTKNDTKALIKEIDSSISDLKLKKINAQNSSDQLDIQLPKLVKDQELLNALSTKFSVLDSKEFRDLDSSEYKTYLEFLYTTKNFYTYLSKLNTSFASVGGYMEFESGSASYEYVTYIASIRNTFKNLIQLDSDRVVLMKKLGTFLEVLYGKDFMAGLEQADSYNTQLKNLWSKVVPDAVDDKSKVNNNIYTDNELNKRAKEDVALQDIIQSINSIAKNYNENGAYNKDFFTSKDKLKNALSLSKSLLDLYKKYNKEFYKVFVGYKKDYAVGGNAIMELINSSDQDFKNFYINSQNWANENEGIEADIKLYNLALANFNKYTIFPEKEVDYRLNFNKKSVNDAYHKLIDDYYARFAVLFKYQDEQNAKNSQASSTTSPTTITGNPLSPTSSSNTTTPAN